MDVINLIALLKRKDHWECGEPASDAILNRYEELLKVGLPTEYSQVLRKYGYIRWSGQYIAGVCSARTKFDVVARTKTAKEDQYFGAKFPAHGLAINRYGGGGDYVLFGSQSEREGKLHCS